ncbi:hypothetical protein P175DRAFT_0433825 [Aspergillus ochraceoroseus IBT 24754]|uniref:HIT-type domain-containing protein n=2 Tax=Aspergillus ochraceoroseus TaxID=138278 RepID=A0A2T5M424_9EURO|nr:uncharacterized protein P175DRAFT_0433825 [Aspergillus ochraceoroseus IBT 24754]KKK12477.1 hypothetical protein AOCH_001915 [Aspergillus ochraceoroseus]PTU23285.1 hypothetical protein P175DRAFT_0433825 [Aspergillus ochraceoroseus IBT 24754]
MTSLCEVCASEAFKYRCPTCGLMSCSLACTQSHKIYCAPKAQSTEPLNEATNTENPLNATNGLTGEETQSGFDFKAPKFLSQAKDLLEQYPSLRDQLRDIYKATLQEEWVESPVHGDRTRQFGRGKPIRRHHGPWTREKGFNRGLGKVRKFRERCEDGLETGKNAQGFMQLFTLVNEENTSKAP